MIFEDIKKDNITALKAHDKVRRAALTNVLGKMKMKQLESEDRTKPLDDITSSKLISKTIKELEDEKSMFVKANRLEKVSELDTQINYLKAYLPKQLTVEEIAEIINGLEDKSIPAVMKHFNANYSGKVDMGLVNKTLRSI